MSSQSPQNATASKDATASEISLDDFKWPEERFPDSDETTISSPPIEINPDKIKKFLERNQKRSADSPFAVFESAYKEVAKGKSPPWDKPEFYSQERFSPNQILRQSTFRSLEILKLINELFPRYDHFTKMLITRSLVNSPANASYTKMRQDSIKELNANHEFYNFVDIAKKVLTPFLEFMNISDRFLSDSSFIEVRDEFNALLQLIDETPEPSSSYNKYLLDFLKQFARESKFAKMMQSGITRTPTSIKPREDNSSKLAWNYWPGKTSKKLTGIAAILITAAPFIPAVPILESVNPLACFGSAAGLLYMAYGLKGAKDMQTVLHPLRKQIKRDELLYAAMDAIGTLSEMAAWSHLYTRHEEKMCFPEIVDTEKHYFKATDLGHPLFLSDPKYVTSDIELGSKVPLMITGSTSGGKSTFVRAIDINQLFFQAGGPIFATSATASPADFVGYQSPSSDKIGDPTGRFGAELKETAEIIFPATGRSLSIYDELAGGATHGEQIAKALDFIQCHGVKGDSLVIVTHNIDLVRQVLELGKGLPLMTEIRKGTCTHRIIPGVAESSHSEITARELGLDKESLAKHLVESGYLPESSND